MHVRNNSISFCVRHTHAPHRQACTTVTRCLRLLPPTMSNPWVHEYSYLTSLNLTLSASNITLTCETIWSKDFVEGESQQLRGKSMFRAQERSTKWFASLEIAWIQGAERRTKWRNKICICQEQRRKRRRQAKNEIKVDKVDKADNGFVDLFPHTCGLWRKSEGVQLKCIARALCATKIRGEDLQIICGDEPASPLVSAYHLRLGVCHSVGLSGVTSWVCATITNGHRRLGMSISNTCRFPRACRFGHPSRMHLKVLVCLTITCVCQFVIHLESTQRLLCVLPWLWPMYK